MATKTAEQDHSHHVQQSLCTNRPLYRQGRKLTAVKVYTVASESQHLFIYGVPKINLRNELKSLCTKYGQINALHVVEDVETEAFTECFHVSYQRIQSARIAKKFLDNKSFYGGVLHVCYTPEYESMQELKYKLEQRRYDVLKRLYGDQVQKPNFKEVTRGLPTTSQVINRKRKRPAVEITEERMSEVDPMIAWKNVPKELDPRISSNRNGDAHPKKHYIMGQEAQSNGMKDQANTAGDGEVKKVRIAIKTRDVYGPQLPTDIVLNQEEDFGENVEGNGQNSTNHILIPTQVVLSKEYVYKNMKMDSQAKRIVFRQTKE